eukprot:11190324-Lingulodinium_polyedra.AAC.1
MWPRRPKPRIFHPTFSRLRAVPACIHHRGVCHRTAASNAVETRGGRPLGHLLRQLGLAQQVQLRTFPHQS